MAYHCNYIALGPAVGELQYAIGMAGLRQIRCGGRCQQRQRQHNGQHTGHDHHQCISVTDQATAQQRTVNSGQIKAQRHDAYALCGSQ